MHHEISFDSVVIQKLDFPRAAALYDKLVENDLIFQTDFPRIGCCLSRSARERLLDHDFLFNFHAQ